MLTPAPPASRPLGASRRSTDRGQTRPELAGLMQTLTSRARFLTAGGTPPDLGVGQPPSDSDVLGPSSRRTG